MLPQNYVLISYHEGLQLHLVLVCWEKSSQDAGIKGPLEVQMGASFTITLEYKLNSKRFAICHPGSISFKISANTISLFSYESFIPLAMLDGW